jgi:hypothetical protein
VVESPVSTSISGVLILCCNLMGTGGRLLRVLEMLGVLRGSLRLDLALGLSLCLGLGGLIVDLGATTTVIGGKRRVAVRALVVHILEGGDHIRDTAETDNAAGEESHEMSESTGLISDSGHDALMALRALNRGRLGSEADKRDAVRIRGNSVLRAETGGLVLRRAIAGLRLLLVDGGRSLVLDGDRCSRRNDLAGRLRAHIAHLVLGAGGLRLRVHG